MSTENDAFALEVITKTLGIKTAMTERLLDGWGRADVHVALGEQRHLFIEVETNQRHPSTNVLKYWPWLEDNPHDCMILVHAFMRPVTVSPNRLRLARWAGNRMAVELPRRFWYHYLEITHGQVAVNGIDDVLKARDELLR